MAATERKRMRRKIVPLILLLAAASSLHADRAADVRAQISYVASALSSGNPTDALGPFDKSYKGYQKLKDYFQTLTASFEVTSEVEVLDEQDEEAETKLLVNWILTLTDPRITSDLSASSSERRSMDITIRLALKNGKWKITDLSPVEIFNPQGTQASKH